MHLLRNVIKPLAKSVLLPLGLTAAASETYAALQNNIYGSGTTKLITSNKEIEDLMEIVKSLKESGLLIKGLNETIKNEAKEENGRFLKMLLGNLGPRLLGNLLTEKGAIRAGEG